MHADMEMWTEIRGKLLVEEVSMCQIKRDQRIASKTLDKIGLVCRTTVPSSVPAYTRARGKAQPVACEHPARARSSVVRAGDS